jgi:tetratricopeptide (TPR) repeat protein
MYDLLVDQAQAKQERVWAEIKNDRLINEAKKAKQQSINFETKIGVTKMKATSLRALTILLLLAMIAITLTAVSSAPEAVAHGPEHEHPAEAASETDKTPLLGNLGDSHHPITTQSELAQRYFNQGLILAYGFNHQKAIESFEEAIKHDSQCAMCYWGIAYALGPNINAPMDNAAVPEAYAAIQQAQKLAAIWPPFIAAVPEVSAAIQQAQKLTANVSPHERAYIQALAKRYSAEPVADRAELDLAYANAMREVAKQDPYDPDALTLFAEALMDVMPWNYWTKDGQPTEYTNEIVTTLESVLERYPNHAGANHFYIHAVEASQTPERAIPSAERLEGAVPGAGHLVHMPAHAYWRTGRYHDAYRVNEAAVHSDEHTVGGKPDQGAHTLYSLLYYPHNIHFLMATAQMEGRSQEALAAARRVASDIPLTAYQEVAAMEDFMPLPLFAMVRFGQWEAILKEPQPKAEFQYAAAIWHWARGLAYTRQGELDRAAAEYDKLVAIGQTEAMKNLTLYSFAQASTMLDIATHVLAGELAGARGEMEQMVVELEKAVAIQDGLHYMEPPSWHYPMRHNLGAALLKAGRAAEAEAVYQEDLRQYPNNGWSLFGLTESLKAQGKTADAAKVQQQFEAAWQYADITLTTSRF